MAQRSLPKRLWYEFLRVFFRLLGTVVFRVRVFNRQHVPASGGVLVLSNHQSHLDPIFIGLSCDRRLNYLARDTLFGFAPFRWLINSLDAIPIDREGIGLGGLKESLKRLKAGEMLLIFPEGTRTRDGEVGRLKPGFLALARRSNSDAAAGGDRRRLRIDGRDETLLPRADGHPHSIRPATGARRLRLVGRRNAAARDQRPHPPMPRRRPPASRNRTEFRSRLQIAPTTAKSWSCAVSRSAGNALRNFTISR